MRVTLPNEPLPINSPFFHSIFFSLGVTEPRGPLPDPSPPFSDTESKLLIFCSPFDLGADSLLRLTSTKANRNSHSKEKQRQGKLCMNHSTHRLAGTAIEG